MHFPMESSSARPRRKSSFRRVCEVCDRVVQLYFAEGKVLKIYFASRAQIPPHFML